MQSKALDKFMFGELASLVRFNLGLLGTFTGELASPYLHYWITIFIHILKYNEPMVWTMPKSL